MRGTVLAVGIEDGDRHVTAHGDELALADLGDVPVADLDRAFGARLEERGVDHLRRATDVERTHGELGARLADRLGGNDAHRFADVDRRAPCEVAAVAGGAATGSQIAGQRRADLHRLHLGRLDGVHVLFGEEHVLLDDDLAGDRVVDVLSRGTAEDALADGRNDLAGIDDRLHGEATLSAAIERDNDRVLRHVDETAGQVARVRGLQRRVRETLAGAVGGVEVLENGEAFLEVGRDRGLDDRAVRTRHQAAHAGELLHLLRRTASTRVAHHVDRVDRLLAAGLGIDLNGGNALHHLLGDLVAALGPGIDHLVVLLALSDQAVVVLLLELLDLLAGSLDDVVLGRPG